MPLTLRQRRVDWHDGLLLTNARSSDTIAKPARLSIGVKLRELLEAPLQSGDLFPTIKRAKPNAGSTEFQRAVPHRPVCLWRDAAQLSIFLGETCQRRVAIRNGSPRRA